MKIFTLTLVLSISICICQATPIASLTNDDSIQLKKITDADNSFLLKLTKEILTCLKNKNYSKFVTYIHPVSGVRFSPYTYVEEGDVKLKADQFINTLNKNKKILWGAYDGTGDDIRLTVKEYLKKFVYDVDYLKEKMSVNKTLSHGNTINNIKEFYPGCDYVEMYHPGKEDGNDWSGLRFIFKKYNGKYFLVGIVHDEWTI